jgi:hypothetical protein
MTVWISSSIRMPGESVNAAAVGTSAAVVDGRNTLKTNRMIDKRETV